MTDLSGFFSRECTWYSSKVYLVHFPTVPGTVLLISLFCLFSQGGEIDFARDIRPILNAKCTECHGGVKAAGDVSFVYEDRVINFEGDSGYPVVKPGDVEESELFYRITTDDEDERMPPPEHHPPLSEKEIALIKKWIEEGGKWTDHWAFVPPRMPEIPETKFADSCKNDIDRFLFHRLEEKGWSPSEPESAGRLLRRLHLALTGLPPTLEESDAFAKAHAAGADAAVEAVVDDLLARPTFGERWASMWLDLVRYADSGGLGQDQKRTIWAYRDWVVKAFNNDMPFDQFTVKQLAGDLLPDPTIDDLVATACHRNTQTNDEGGTDDETFRVEAVIDRVNTTWQTWGSITFGCVQCHDHPYDPIRMTEYYQFMDFFNNSADSDLPNDAPLIKVPSDSADSEKMADLYQRVLDLKKSIHNAGMAQVEKTEWIPVTEMKVSAQNGTKYVVEKWEDGTAEFHTEGTVQVATHTILEIEKKDLPEVVTALRLKVDPLNPETAGHSPEWGFLIAKTEAHLIDAEGKKTEVRFRYSVADVPWRAVDPWGDIGADGKNWGADSRIHHRREIVLIPDQALAIPDGGKLTIRFHCNKTGHGHPMAMKRGQLAVSSDESWTNFNPKSAEQSELRTALSQLRKIPATTVPVMFDRSANEARPTHFFVRGNMLDKEDRVTAGMPESLTAVAPSGGDPDRLAMAKWWSSESHPLTSRVFVNRLWEQLFGTGIVPTLEDFGSSGEKPTHPELLDYLAIRFQKTHNWSTKKILRDMVLSHAFRQSNRLTPELAEHDPDNRYLARGPRLRLTAEQVRDHALAVSGLLVKKQGGPPVHPPIPGGVWRPFQSKDKWDTPEAGSEDRYRRSIYTYIKRSIPYPTFATFDAPSREFCTPRRLRSNTPLQALVTLNDAAFVECAEALAAKMNTDYPEDIEERISRAHLLVTGRKPGESRLAEMQKLYNGVSKSAGDIAAMVALSQLLLNLDETLSY